MMGPITSNPLRKSEEEFFAGNDLNEISRNFKMMKLYLKPIVVSLAFIVCSNFYLLYSASHLIRANTMNSQITYPIPEQSITGSETENEYVYESLPDLSTSQSKHVVNLVDYADMDAEFKDNIFNNLDSIIVQDGEIGTSRHQITKVNWMFDEADTMLLYTALGEVFALAANGTISAYDTVNGARKLLQSQIGWLEGKISDVIHHGSSYKEMRERGKAYMKTRENRKEEIRLSREISEINDNLIQAELLGKDVTEYREKIEEIQDQKEIILKEKEKINIVEQKPLQEKSLDEFMREQEIERIEKSFEDTKLKEINEFRSRKEEELENYKNKSNETLNVLRDEKNILIYSYSHVLNATRISKDEELKTIKYDLGIAKAELDVARMSISNIIETEHNETKLSALLDIEKKLQDTTLNIAFTQLTIEDGSVSEFDQRPIKDRVQYNKDIINVQDPREIENIYKSEEERTHPDEEEEHAHPDEEGEHAHPDEEGEHTHPDEEGEHTHPDEEGEHSHPDEEGESDNERYEWTEVENENIVKNCSTHYSKEVCICTDKLTNEIYRC